MNQQITSQSSYDALGGEQVVRQLVEHFYDRMAESEEFRPLRILHTEDLRLTKDRFFWFLSGWLGGPLLYAEKIGLVNLPQIHKKIVIGILERDLWVKCMTMTFDELSVAEPLRSELIRGLASLAEQLRMISSRNS